MTTVVATPGPGPDQPTEVSYTDAKVIGNGSFGVVYQAKLCENDQHVAIKKVLQDKRFKVVLLQFLFVLFDCHIFQHFQEYKSVRTVDVSVHVPSPPLW